MTTYARRLGLFSGTMAVIGGIIGGGIFRTPATVAERVGSPTLVLAVWIVGGVVALIGAFCFGELGQRRPKAGGGYVYLRETWGPLAGFLYGWALLLVIATGAIAAVAVTFANYALALAGLSAGLTVPVAIGAIALLTVINYLGVKPAAVTQNVFTLLKLAALAALIVAGLVFAVPSTVLHQPGRGDRGGRSGHGCRCRSRADPLHLWGLATDQLHRRGDRRAGAESASRPGPRGRGSGGRLPARQRRVPAGARTRAAR